MPILELVVRESLVYVAVFILLRTTMRRTAGQLTMLDIVIILLGYRFPWVEQLIAPAPLQVVRDGRLLRRNMRRELLTERELFVQLREQGIEDIAHVKAAYIEGDGLVSVIHHDDEHREHAEAGRSLLTEAD